MFDNETHFLQFFPKILIKNVFFKTSCSPGGPPSDFQNVKNSPEPPTTVMTPKVTSKPTNLIRDENIQFTATPCSTWDTPGVSATGTQRPTGREPEECHTFFRKKTIPTRSRTANNSVPSTKIKKKTWNSPLPPWTVA